MREPSRERAGESSLAFQEAVEFFIRACPGPPLAMRGLRGLAPLSGQGRHDLLEVLDDRYARRGTLLASQVPVEHWHDVVGDPTFGDAILDRLLNNAHRITLKGASMRRLYDSTKEPRAVSGNA